MPGRAFAKRSGWKLKRAEVDKIGDGLMGVRSRVCDRDAREPGFRLSIELPEFLAEEGREDLVDAHKTLEAVLNRVLEKMQSAGWVEPHPANVVDMSENAIKELVENGLASEEEIESMMPLAHVYGIGGRFITVVLHQDRHTEDLFRAEDNGWMAEGEVEKSLREFFTKIDQLDRIETLEKHLAERKAVRDK